jgi:hypothetical protein
MTRRALLLPLTAALACATGTPHGLLRVELAGPEAGPGSPLELRLLDAVRSAADGEGLACRPGTGADLLRCTAATLGNQAHGLTVALRRAGSGYALAVEQAIHLPGTSTPVCAAQARFLDRLAAELGPPAVRVDGRSDCK